MVLYILIKHLLSADTGASTSNTRRIRRTTRSMKNHPSGINPTNTWVNLYLQLMPDDTTLNSGCTQEKSDAHGGLPPKRISVGLFSCVEKVLRGTPEAEWGDKNIVTRPLCHHGTICRVKGKSGEQFFGCEAKDRSCGYFEWINPPNEDPTSEKKVVTSEQTGKEETHDLGIKVTDS